MSKITFGRHFRFKGVKHYTGGFASKKELENAIKSIKDSLKSKIK